MALCFPRKNYVSLETTLQLTSNGSWVVVHGKLLYQVRCAMMTPVTSPGWSKLVQSGDWQRDEHYVAQRLADS